MLPAQQLWLHDLPGLLWQQWFEAQSAFTPQPVQPDGIPEAASAADGTMLVTSDVAVAATAPANPTRRIISRRETSVPLFATK